MTLLNINKNSKDIRGILVLPEKATQNIPAIISKYLQPLGEFKNKVLVVGVFLPNKGALKKSIADEEISEIKEVAETYDVKNIFIANADYMKFFLKLKKKPAFERSIGSVFETDEGYKVLPILNYQILAFQPRKKGLLQTGVDTILQVMEGTFVDNKEEFLESLDIKLCKSFSEAHKCLKDYMKCEAIAVDIETTGLKWYEDELLTISFAKSETEGFSVALHPKYSDDWEKNRKLIKSFFENYKGLSVFHNGGFDTPFLVYNLWMDSLTDTKNMIKGVNSFSLVDTLVMAYLCLNSVERPKLGLKELAYSKYGNWDKDIDQKDLINYPFEDVGRYNTIDTTATYWLYNKYSKMLIDEEQDTLYMSIYQPFLPAIIKMTMVGVNVNVEGIKEGDKELEKIYNDNYQKLLDFDAVQETVELLKEQARKKGKRQSEIDKIVFNPRSSVQVQTLLYKVLNLPVLNKTGTGNPAADKKTIELLMKELDGDSTEYQIVNALYEIALVKTVRSSFTNKIPKIAVKTDKGDKIYANYNIAKVISGRLSSSGAINLQNLPSGSAHAKIIKGNLVAEKDMIIGYIDFSSLESRIGANFMNSKNMKDVYRKGFDSHLYNLVRLRPTLLKEKGIDIDINDPKQLNALKDVLKKERGAIKPNVFMLQYFASPKGLAANLKIPLSDAEMYYNEYHNTYPEVKQYLAKVEQQLLKYGYATTVMGLKVRCDLSNITDNQSYQQALRTTGNALIQGGGVLMVRSIAKFQKWIEKEGLEEKVKPFITVHDSLGVYLTKDVDVIYKVNKKLVEILCEPYPTMDIPNEAELELGLNIAEVKLLRNNATKEEVKHILEEIS